MMWNEWEHNNLPPPFNPLFKPLFKPYAQMIHDKVSPSMEADNFYENHTRSECKVEFRKRYDEFIKEYEDGL